jgi:hypothetical protein
MPSFLRRHAGASITAGVAVAALAGGGIAYAATSPGTSSTVTPPAAAAPTTTAPPTSTTTGGQGGGKAGGAQRRATGARGTITAVTGSTWTLRTVRGLTVTVTITPQTKFGTPKAPATAASFPVGAPATIVGQRTGPRALTATRVVVPRQPLGSGSTTTTAPGTAG